MRTYLNLFLLLCLCVSPFFLSSCGGDESGLETFTEPVPAEGATEIADHPDTKADTDVFTLIPWDDSKNGTVFVNGHILGVYSDGARKIELYVGRYYNEEDEGKVISIPADRSVVFRYKMTTEAWTELYDKEKWTELMEGYITEDQWGDWVAGLD